MLDRGTGIKGELDGMLVKNTMAAYAHLHAASYTGFAGSFVDFIFHAFPNHNSE